MAASFTHDEKDLLNQIAGGNEKAFRALYDQYHNKIYSVALKLTKNDVIAQDVVQEIFIKLWLNRDKLVGIEFFNAYLNTLIRNHVLNSLRRLANEEIFLQELIAEGQKSEGNTFDTIVYNDLRKRLYQAVSMLTPQQKKAYNFSRAEGLKHEEIATLMNVSRETVKKHITDALRSIKTHLNEDEIALMVVGILFYSSRS